jgi:uncharacterized membrane protein YbhN (UPF0104 family)
LSGRTIRLVGSSCLLGLLAWRLDWRQLAEAFAQLDARFWALAVLAYVFTQVVSSLRWQMLSGPLGFRAPWRHYLSFYFIGMFFNLLLPTSVGGDVVRALYLANGPREQARPARGEAALSVFADRASGLAVLVALACAAGWLCPRPLPGWMTAVLLGLGGCTVLGLASLPGLPLVGKLPVIGPRLGLLIEASGVYLRRPGLLVGATLLSVVVQWGNVVFVWLVALGLGLDVSLGYLSVVVPLVALLTLLPVSVGGVGLREFGMMVLLAPVGVGESKAVTLSLLTFAASAAVGLVGAGLYLFGQYPRYAVTSMEGSSDADPHRGGADQGRARQPSAAA